MLRPQSRNKVLSLLAVSGVIFPAMDAVAAAPADFTVTSGSKTFTLASATGKYVALHFLLKTECPFCLRHVQEYARRGPSVAGVEHVFLKPDSDDEIRAWTAQLGDLAGTVTIYRDPDASLAAQFDVPDGLKLHDQTMRHPALILLGPDGREVFRHVGKDNTDRLPFSKFADKMTELSKTQHLGEYNLKPREPAISGYDPVAYIESSKAEKGVKDYASAYRGVMYLFKDETNRAMFAANPAKYLPTYGGWCATAMADGDKVDIDPTNFKVTNGRLFLFYKGLLGNAQKDWNKNEPELTRKADAAWAKLAPSEK